MICIFCFYNVSSGIQSRLAFSKVFKHCNIVMYDGDIWLATDFDLTGIHSRRINAPSARAFIRGLKHIESLTALVVADVGVKADTRWKPYVVRSCNELDRYISGVDIGFTFNPKHLYNKLLKYNGSNYKILYDWRR